MKQTLSNRSSSIVWFLAAGIYISIFGCAVNNQELPPAPVIEQNVQCESDCEDILEILEKQKQLNARLQMSLLEKHAEVNKLTLKNEHLSRAFVRNKVKLRNRGNKVEAVRLLAEVTTVIDTARENNPGGSWDEVLDKADQYLLESRTEIEKGNLEIFFSLVSKAFEQVQAIELEKREDGQQVLNPEIIFLIPMPMKLMANSNVRVGPSHNEKVKFVLSGGSEVIAVGYKGNWVKVKIADQDEDDGWIHFSLLNGA